MLPIFIFLYRSQLLFSVDKKNFPCKIVGEQEGFPSGQFFGSYQIVGEQERVPNGMSPWIGCGRKLLLSKALIKNELLNDVIYNL